MLLNYFFITEACRPIYEATKHYPNFSEHSTNNRSKSSSEFTSSSSSTTSYIYKPNTMLYSESSDYSKSLDMSDKFHGSLISDKQENLYSQASYSVSCLSSKCVEPVTQTPKTDLLRVDPIPHMKLTNTFAKVNILERTTHKTTELTSPVLERSPSPDFSIASSPKAQSKRPGGIIYPEKLKNHEMSQCEFADKHTISKAGVPSSLTKEKKRDPEGYSRPIVVERSQVEFLCYEKPKKVSASGPSLRIGNELATISDRPQELKELKRKSILRKPNYNVESSPPYKKPRVIDIV